MGQKESSNLFDVTMGSYDGTETCELVEAFLLHNSKEKYGNNFGLYRDEIDINKKSSHPLQII